MRHPVRTLLVLLFALVGVVVGGQAFAQNVGSLSGHIYDQAGIPLRGVSVTITSDTQIGGAKTTVTNDEGEFRFQGLFPGKFKIVAKAPKLRPLAQENVRVNAGTATDLDLVMDVETAVEEIKIIEKAPVVNMGTTTVGESFDLDFLNSLPLQTRDYQGVAAMTAGVSDPTGSGNPQVRGGTFFNNTYTVDGFDTTDPVTHTFGQNFSFNAMANEQVLTAGVGAENANTTGGVINVVTRSGSNRFEVDGTVEYQDQHLRLFTDNLDRGTNRLAVANVNFGGPIMKDRLWFFLSAQGVDNTSTLPANPNLPDHPSYHVKGFDGLAKLTWRPSTRNEFTFKGTLSPATFNNSLQSPLVEPEAEARQVQRTETAILGYQYTGELYINALFGYMQQQLDVEPQSCDYDPAHCTQKTPQFDILTGLLRQNYTSQSINQRRDLQFSGSVEWIRNTLHFGGHGLRFTWKYVSAQNEIRSTVPGDAIYNNAGTQPFSRSQICSNDPLSDNGDCHTNYLITSSVGNTVLLSLADVYRPTRHLTITPGVAFHVGNSENDKGLQVTNITAFTPHFSTVWDATHDGKTKLSLTADGLADPGFLSLANFTNRRLYRRNCNWNAMAKAYVDNCTVSGGNDSTTVGLPCGPTGVASDGSPCRNKLITPRVWETTLGGEREIVSGVGISATFVYRKFTHQWEDMETNGNWNAGGTDLNRQAPFKTNRSILIFDLETPEAAKREYRGLTVALRKREGRLKALASYTLSKYEGVEDSDFVSTFLDNPGQNNFFYGPLPADVRHDLRAQATYQANPWLSFGATYFYSTGAPYNRFYFDQVYQSFQDFRSQRGTYNNGTPSPKDDLPLRLPDLTELDLQARFSLEPLIKQRINLWVDVLNVLSLRTTTAVIETDGPFWGQPAARMAPFRARFGLQYWF